MWILWVILTLLLIKLFNKLSTGRCYVLPYMTGNVVIVTGANSGIGFETALKLARRGAKVILACRDEKKGKEAADRISRMVKHAKVRYQYLDLCSLSSIREFVDKFKESEAKLDILINNAGASGMGLKKTEDGIIRDMQVNHFGAFLLTLLLVPLLKKSAPSRVVMVSSVLHKFGTTNDINEEGKYGYLKNYCNSKLCNVLFSNELARRLEGTGVIVNSLHPGHVNTTLFRSTFFEKLRCLVLYSLLKTPEEGAQTALYLAASDDCSDVTGGYFVDCAEGQMSLKAENPVLASELWSLSEKLVGLRAEETI